MGFIADELSPREDGKAAPASESAARKVDHGPLWRGLSNAERVRVNALATELNIAAGDLLCVEAKPAHHVFTVTAGMIKLYKLLPGGRRQISRFLYAGDFLGLPNGAESYGSTAQAVTATKVWRFERRAFANLLNAMPKLERRLLTIAWQELEDDREHMLLLGRKGAEQKVASFLLWLAHRQGTRRDEDAVALPMTRRDIADYLGLEVETVSRTLTRLQRRGMIVLPHFSRARLLSPDGLECLARGPEGKSVR